MTIYINQKEYQIGDESTHRVTGSELYSLAGIDPMTTAIYQGYPYEEGASPILPEDELHIVSVVDFSSKALPENEVATPQARG